MKLEVGQIFRLKSTGTTITYEILAVNSANCLFDFYVNNDVNNKQKITSSIESSTSHFSKLEKLSKLEKSVL